MLLDVGGRHLGRRVMFFEVGEVSVSLEDIKRNRVQETVLATLRGPVNSPLCPNYSMAMTDDRLVKTTRRVNPKLNTTITDRLSNSRNDY